MIVAHLANVKALGVLVVTLFKVPKRVPLRVPHALGRAKVTKSLAPRGQPAINRNIRSTRCKALGWSRVLLLIPGWSHNLLLVPGWSHNLLLVPG